jgi:hypothetical protein
MGQGLDGRALLRHCRSQLRQDALDALNALSEMSGMETEYARAKPDSDSRQWQHGAHHRTGFGRRDG